MRILFLAPHPFFQERGTPIAVHMMLKALSERGDEIDVLTFHLGENRSYPKVRLSRTRPPFPPSSIAPGFSWKKVYCDLFLLRDAVKMVRARRYDLVHAVEEASFIAMALCRMYRIPYVIDMDSSMSLQIVERFRWLHPLSWLLRRLEEMPLARAIAVVPMCEDLAVQARRASRGIVHVLKDVSLIAENPKATSEDLRELLGIEGPILMYVGNLERYQGIGLLLEGFARVLESHPHTALVIIGGSERHIARYSNKARALALGDNVHFLGPRPVSALGGYLAQADLLVSPRIHGNNTPMKIYSYLDSGVAVVATALPTHTQVMTEDEAALAPPEPAALAATINRLLDDARERERLASNAKSLVRREHSWPSFRRRVEVLFGELEGRLAQNS